MALIPHLDHHQNQIHYSLAQSPSVHGGTEISSQIDNIFEGTAFKWIQTELLYIYTDKKIDYDFLETQERLLEKRTPVLMNLKRLTTTERERYRPEDTVVCSDEPNSAESSHCWSAEGPPSHPSSHPLPARTHTL